MTTLLNLIRECRIRQDDDFEIVKAGNHDGAYEFKMRDGKFWSEGRLWTLEELIVESMRPRNREEAGSPPLVDSR